MPLLQAVGTAEAGYRYSMIEEIADRAERFRADEVVYVSAGDGASFTDRSPEFVETLQGVVVGPDGPVVVGWGGRVFSGDAEGLVEDWLAGDPAEPAPPESRKRGRNHTWWHMSAADVMTMIELIAAVEPEG